MANEPIVKFVTTTSDKLKEHGEDLPNGSIAFMEDTKQIAVKIKTEENINNDEVE